MQKNKLFKFMAVLLTAACMFGFTACSKKTSSSDQTTIYGKVTSISGSNVTLALGTMKNQGQPGAQAGGGQGGAPGSNGTPPSGGQGSISGGNGTPPSGGQGSVSGANGTPQSGGQGNVSGSSGTQPGDGQGGGFGTLTLTGKSKTITISDTSVLSKESNPGAGGAGGQTAPGQTSSGTTSSVSGTNSSTTKPAVTVSNTTASLSDITVGAILKVTYKTSTSKLQSVTITSSMGGDTTK